MDPRTDTDRVVLAVMAVAAGGGRDMVLARLRALNLRAPCVLGRTDLSCVSVVTVTSKRRGWYQRTCFSRCAGPGADDDLHETLEEAVLMAYSLGYTHAVDPSHLSDYLPRP
jgi:hypothetical protein